MKLKLSIGVAREEHVEPVDEEIIKRATQESHWQHGYIHIKTEYGEPKKILKGERKKFLGEYEYRVGEQTLSKETIGGFDTSEYLPWRDGEIPEDP